MDDMESFLMMVFIIGGAWAWIAWYWSLARIPEFVSPSKYRTSLLWTPVACAVLLWFILRTFASFDVVNSLTYLSFYFLFGATWLGAAVYVFPFFGHQRTR